MSIQSEAANRHIEALLKAAYPLNGAYRKEYRFCERLWRMDFAVPSILCAIELDGGTFQGIRTGHASGVGLRNWREKNNAAMTRGWRVWHYAPEEVIRAGRKRHMISTKVGITVKPNPWVGRCVSVTLPDEPILRRLPWL